MTNITLDRDRILRIAKKNTNVIDGVEYSYDSKFDILRVNFGDSSRENGRFLSSDIYGIFINGKIKFIEIYDFKQSYDPKHYSEIIQNKNIISNLESIHDQICKNN
ncbi:hypothetical protein [Ligilactobacillus acidipiscis]|uniref:hypothetical protein n=1 Tax=Ligilactobacillus acidipiscis TaxID=89059 RepID=UPI0023F6C35A|nr:hypothetical protein [Ligilactobacillus acidipiscis]WEV56678.1 hypothetical protein OZX66_10705 [Ligilactobacillus acidipiscis]